MKSQTKNSSYKKLFSILEDSEDFFEVQILQRIYDDYQKYHEHDFRTLEELLSDTRQDLKCPLCSSNKVIGHGKDKNGTQRYKCKECGKTFNIAKNSLFFSTKINMFAWFAFLECILSGTSTSAACITAKISPVTGSKWMHKIFDALKDYQDDIILSGDVYIDETYVHEDKSKIYYLEELGKVKKVRKQPRGISRNKICILIATDKKKSFAFVTVHGRPQRMKNYEVCKVHIKEESHLIGDEDTSMTYSANELQCKRTMYKSNTELAYEKLEPIDQLCNRFKFFIDKHRGFKKDLLQDYINLFIFIENEKHNDDDLYKVTVKLMKMMTQHSKKVEK
ncbi:MAG: IS1595 family transposase [Erysipelotrichaceae bacterium]|nr:IS1595 family transposase [Erysipelotrichaceae bacterium]